MAERLRAIWERIKDDIHRNPGLWIGVGITAVVAVIAYLAYRKSTGLNVPANGFGFPDYGGASGGGGTDTGGLGYQPYQPPSNPSNPFNPTGPVSTPVAPFPPFSFGPFGPPTAGPIAPPSHVIGSVQDQGVDTSAVQNPSAASDAQHKGITNPVQNPTAAQTQQHRGTTPLPLAAAIQNPTAASQNAHRGVTHPAQHAPPHHVVTPHINHFIPTTKRSRNSGHGRAA